MSAPPLAVEQPDGTRRYVHPVTAEAQPSITTIIDQIAKPGLTPWATRRSGEFAARNWEEMAGLSPPEKVDKIRLASARETEAARQVGTAVHELIQDWSTGVPHAVSPQISSYANQFVSFMIEAKPRFLRNEFTVWSGTYGYAGTADALIVIDGHTYLVDFKCGRNLHEEVGLQLSALAHADCILHPDGAEEEIPAIEFLAAVHIRPRSHKMVIVNHDRENFRAFLAARQLFDWTLNVKPTVLGRGFCRG
jgi:hypothetical protein